MTDDQKNFGYGQASPFDTVTPFNVLSFVIEQAIGRIGTMRIVQVVAVSNSGGLAPVGTVDVLPLVNQVDGMGNAVKGATVFGLLYLRVQGGTDAFIMDPKVGDIGIAVISDRDTSAVRANKGQANPGSGRRFSISDGVYIGGVLGAQPTQYVQFNDDGVHISSPKKVEAFVEAAKVTLTPQSSIMSFGDSAKVTLSGAASIFAFGGINVTVDAAAIHLNGPVVFNGVATGIAGTVDFGASHVQTTGSASVGSLASAGDVVGAGKSLATHPHGGVQPGSGTSGPPI